MYNENMFIKFIISCTKFKYELNLIEKVGIYWAENQDA